MRFKKQQDGEGEIACSGQKQSMIPTILVTAVKSGSGKTLLTCGLLELFKQMGLAPSAFKCGPDYIDPMFHRQVLGVSSYNLDAFLAGRDHVREIFEKQAGHGKIAVIEGVMGYYDGLAGISKEASAWDIAGLTEAPAILLVDCKGVSVSVLPLIKGFLEYTSDSHIQGVIFNRLSPMLYPRMKQMVETEVGVAVLGYVPNMENLKLESRHLGLVLPEEVEGLQGEIAALAGKLRETLEVEKLLKVARGFCPEVSADTGCSSICDKEKEESLQNSGDKRGIPAETYETVFSFHHEKTQKKTGVPHEGNPGESCSGNKADEKKRDRLRIGLARDGAFCFIYERNLELLEEMGAQLVPFSPLRDAHLPENLDGLLLYGGYPELHLKELQDNRSMRSEIKAALESGMPCMAECGGFMYLTEGIEATEKSGCDCEAEGKDTRTSEYDSVKSGCDCAIEDKDTQLSEYDFVKNGKASEADVSICEREEKTSKSSGKVYEMVGVVSGISRWTTSLKRFGYATLSGGIAFGEVIGEIPCHEFHYYDSDDCGSAWTAKKPLSNRSWTSMVSTDTLFVGYPHLYYEGNRRLPEAFLRACARYCG